MRLVRCLDGAERLIRSMKFVKPEQPAATSLVFFADFIEPAAPSAPSEAVNHSVLRLNDQPHLRKERTDVFITEEDHVGCRCQLAVGRMPVQRNADARIPCDGTGSRSV